MRRALLCSIVVGAAVLVGCGPVSVQGPSAREGTGAAAQTDAILLSEQPPQDQFTPVTVSTVNASTTAVRGTDGRFHVVYELQFQNAKLAPATLDEVQVLDADHPNRVLASYSGRGLRDRMRTLLPLPAKNRAIPVNQGRFLLVDLSFPARNAVPRAVVHRINVRAADNPGATEPTPLTYTVTPYPVNAGRPPVVRPPLRGSGWVAVNGCCQSAGVHRGALETVNGSFFDAQRFAIDWIRLDRDGRFVQGDPTDVHNYAAYGAPVLSATGGTVVDTLDTLPDQVPGTLPDPSTITLETLDGNHVVVDVGNGYYAFYAHLKHGSVRVQPGDRVRPGQVIGRLGNSGNTSAPHLHFHLMAGPSVLGSDGRPYTLSHFALSGQIPAEAFENADGLNGDWSEYLRPPSSRHGQLPLDLTIVDFPR